MGRGVLPVSLRGTAKWLPLERFAIPVGVSFAI